jgi:hypothetical protein
MKDLEGGILYAKKHGILPTEALMDFQKRRTL